MQPYFLLQGAKFPRFSVGKAKRGGGGGGVRILPAALPLFGPVDRWTQNDKCFFFFCCCCYYARRDLKLQIVKRVELEAGRGGGCLLRK